MLDDRGQPQAVEVRTGLTDGSFTEIVTDKLEDGDMVVIGTASAQGAPARPAAASGPRLPF